MFCVYLSLAPPPGLARHNWRGPWPGSVSCSRACCVWAFHQRWPNLPFQPLFWRASPAASFCSQSLQGCSPPLSVTCHSTIPGVFLHMNPGCAVRMGGPWGLPSLLWCCPGCKPVGKGLLQRREKSLWNALGVRGPCTPQGLTGFSFPCGNCLAS